MRVRIGIHFGNVIEKGDGTICGDGVNVAAHLEGLVDPGGITVSESIHVAVRGKGISQCSRVHGVLRYAPSRGRLIGMMVACTAVRYEVASLRPVASAERGRHAGVVEPLASCRSASLA